MNDQIFVERKQTQVLISFNLILKGLNTKLTKYICVQIFIKKLQYLQYRCAKQFFMKIPTNIFELLPEF